MDTEVLVNSCEELTQTTEPNKVQYRQSFMPLLDWFPSQDTLLGFFITKEVVMLSPHECRTIGDYLSKKELEIPQSDSTFVKLAISEVFTYLRIECLKDMAAADREFEGVMNK